MMGGICDRCTRDRRSTSPFAPLEDIWLCATCRSAVVNKIAKYAAKQARKP